MRARQRQLMLAALVCTVLFACLLAASIAAADGIESTKRMSVELEKAKVALEAAQDNLAKTKLDLSEAMARLDEARDMIKEYTAVASWYGPGFHGRMAADGSSYDQSAFTIAHKTLPFGTIVVIEYRGRRIPAIVTDRGPYIEGRDFDLSLGLAKRLGLVAEGVGEIKVYQIDLEKTS